MPPQRANLDSKENQKAILEKSKNLDSKENIESKTQDSKKDFINSTNKNSQDSNISQNLDSKQNIITNKLQNYKIYNFNHPNNQNIITFIIPIDSNLNIENMILIYKVHFKLSFLALILRYYLGVILWYLIIKYFYRYVKSQIQNLPTQITQENTQNLAKKDKIFLIFSAMLCLSICIFTFWLGFPGFHAISDTYNSIALYKNNWHPVFISYVLEVLYALFGRHLFYLFLFNIVPFYVGLYFLIAGFYLRFRSKFAIVLLFPTFIGNIYFQNFVQYHSFSLPMLLFCGYSMLLFVILYRIKHQKLRQILYYAIAITFVFALLWRHNAIISVFPACFIITYLLLQNRNLDSKQFIKNYAKFISISAITCLAIAIFIPKLLTKGTSYPTNHAFLLQIAGACVPANDATCFKKEWYYPNKNFNNVKELYNQNPTHGDHFNAPWIKDNIRPFKHEKLAGLKSKWIESIFKYPTNFALHELRELKTMWFQNDDYVFNATKMQERATGEWHEWVLEAFKNENEKSITFTPLREQIYTFLFNHKIMLNHIVGVVISFVTLLLTSILLMRKKYTNSLLVYSFSLSFAGFFSALCIALFTPDALPRYMAPVLPLALLSLIGLLAFRFDLMTKTNSPK